MLAGAAPSRSSFGSLIAEVILVAEEVNEMMKSSQEEEPEPEQLPNEVVQALALMGIDPRDVKIFTPRSTGAKAAEACDCNRCVVEEAKAGFLVNQEGEA